MATLYSLDEFKKAIKTVCKALSGSDIQWAVIGSSNLMLQGMNIIPNDLDLIVQWNNMEVVRSKFAPYDPSEIQKLNPLGKIDTEKLEITFNIDTVQVQVIGEISGGVYERKLVDKQLKMVQLDEVEVPCFSLSAEAQAYSETGRETKAVKVREYMNIQSPW